MNVYALDAGVPDLAARDLAIPDLTTADRSVPDLEPQSDLQPPDDLDVPPNPTAYIVNAAGSSGSVSICPVNAIDGSLGTCATNDGDGTFNLPVGISVNAAATTAYIANFNSNVISVCTIAQNGSGNFSGCVAAVDSTINSPTGLALNPAGTYLYVAELGTATISICPVTSAGLTPCTVAGQNAIFTATGGGAGLQSVSINAAGTFLYSSVNDGVVVCPILQDGTGALGTCTALTDATFDAPLGVSFDPSGHHAYVGNYSNNTVSICPILQDGSGAFAACTADTDAAFDFSAFTEVDLWTSNQTGYGYVPNSGNNTLAICPVSSSTGSLSTCTVANGNGTFNEPTSVTLAYVSDSNPDM